MNSNQNDVFSNPAEIKRMKEATRMLGANSQSSPLVSVIIPTHNRAEQLRESMASVLGQTYANLELIVVDDNSQDHTPAVIASFQDPRVKTMRLAGAGHPGISRNIGLRAAHGEYFAFLDDDDIWLPGKLERQIAELTRRPEFKICHTFFEPFGELGVRKYQLLPPQIPKSGRILEELVVHGCIVLTSSVCLHRAVVDKVGGFSEAPELRSGQDYEYFLRIARQFEFLCIAEPLVRYRQQPRSVSESFFMNRGHAIYDSAVKDADILDKYKKRFLANLLFSEAEYKLSQLDQRFRRMFLKSLLTYPYQLNRYVVLPLLILPARLAKTIYNWLKSVQVKHS